MLWTSYNVKEYITIPEFFSLFELDCAKGYHFHGESHNFWECLYVLQGEVCVSADERVYNLKAHDLIFHKPFELHKFYTEHVDGAKILVFSFTLDGELRDYYKNKVFRLSGDRQAIMHSMLEYLQTTLPEVPIVDRRRNYLENVTLPDFFFQILLSYIYPLFLSLHEQTEFSGLELSTDANTFRKAVDYMNSHIDSNPAVGEIAAHCYVSLATLKRIFKKYTGGGIHEYFMKRKANAARELIDSGMTMTETAERLGFSSQAYFSTFYHRAAAKRRSNLRGRG